MTSVSLMEAIAAIARMMRARIATESGATAMERAAFSNNPASRLLHSSTFFQKPAVAQFPLISHFCRMESVMTTSTLMPVSMMVGIAVSKRQTVTIVLNAFAMRQE